MGTEYLTAKEIAKTLKFNHITIQRYIKSGYLPGAKVGNCWRVRKDVFEAWLDMKFNGVSVEKMAEGVIAYNMQKRPKVDDPEEF